MRYNGRAPRELGAWNNNGSEHLFTFPLHVFPFELAAVASSGLLYVKWFHSAGAQGKEPEPKMRELMERRPSECPRRSASQLGKEVWKIAAEEVYIIGVIGMGPASMGVRVVKTNMGNIPSRQYKCPPSSPAQVEQHLAPVLGDPPDAEHGLARQAGVQALGDPIDEQIGDQELAEVPAGEGLVLLPEVLGHLAHGGATQQAGAGGVSECRFDIPRARPARFFGDFLGPPIGDSRALDYRVPPIVPVGG